MTGRCFIPGNGGDAGIEKCFTVGNDDTGIMGWRMEHTNLQSFFYVPLEAGAYLLFPSINYGNCGRHTIHPTHNEIQILKKKGIQTMKNTEKEIMESNIPETLQAGILERLGEVYSRNGIYREALAREKEAAECLKETLTEEQMAMVEEYHAAISATMGVCELLAYRQGMKDMADILR